jgi:hypothetical protein
MRDLTALGLTAVAVLLALALMVWSFGRFKQGFSRVTEAGGPQKKRSRLLRNLLKHLSAVRISLEAGGNHANCRRQNTR